METRETSTGRILTGNYPHGDGLGLGVYELLELLGANVSITDLDDHNRLLAGGILLGLNLGRHKNAYGLDLNRAFKERDL